MGRAFSLGCGRRCRRFRLAKVATRLALIAGMFAIAATPPATPPRRIISMSPNATEILYALGVFDRIVAVSDYDTWPPAVKDLPHIGGWSTPNLERVSALRPDLVVLTEAQNGLIGRQLQQLGVRLAPLPMQTLADVYRAIELAGQASGREPEAKRLVAETRAEVERVRERTRSLPHPTVLCVVDRTPGELRNVYIATTKSHLGELIEAAGGRVAAPDASSGYARLSNEQLLALNPDIILDIVPGSPGRLGGDPEAAWREFPELSALRHHRVIPVREDYVSHPSQFVAKTAVLLAHMIHPEAGL